MQSTSTAPNEDTQPREVPMPPPPPPDTNVSNLGSRVASGEITVTVREDQHASDDSDEPEESSDSEESEESDAVSVDMHDGHNGLDVAELQNPTIAPLTFDTSEAFNDHTEEIIVMLEDKLGKRVNVAKNRALIKEVAQVSPTKAFGFQNTVPDN